MRIKISGEGEGNHPDVSNSRGLVGDVNKNIGLASEVCLRRRL